MTVSLEQCLRSTTILHSHASFVCPHIKTSKFYMISTTCHTLYRHSLTRNGASECKSRVRCAVFCFAACRVVFLPGRQAISGNVGSRSVKFTSSHPRRFPCQTVKAFLRESEVFMRTSIGSYNRKRMSVLCFPHIRQ